MQSSRLAVLAAAGLALVSVPARAQSIISARSGMVHYVDGDVYVADQKIEPKFGNFPEVKENSVLRTELGRAEVLLNPGVFLRVAENSSFRMITSRLIDTRLDILTGSAEVEAAEVTKDTGLTLVCKDATVMIRKAGVYRFDMNPARLRVYSGEAMVQLNGSNIEVGGGKTVAFEGESAGAVTKFDKEDLDALSRWGRRRGEAVAMANVSAAKSIKDSGYSLTSGLWQFNPYLGLMTYIPARGMLMSPYGYSFWSPVTVGRIFYQPPPQSAFNRGWDAGSNMGYTGMPATAGGYSGTAAAMSTSSAPMAVSNSGATSAAAAPASSVGHGAGGAGGGGGRQR